MTETRKMLGHTLLICIFCCRAACSAEAEKASNLCAENKEVVFLLDPPTSIGRDQFQKVLSFIRDMIDRFQESSNKTRIAVVILSTDSDDDIEFDAYQTLDDLKTEVGKIGSSDNNRMFSEVDVRISAAIGRAAGLFSGVDSEQIMICVINAVAITDGDAFLKMEVDRARDRAQKIIAIGVGGKDVRTRLRLLATETSRDFIYSVDDFQGLSSLVDPLSYSMCLDAAICRRKPLQVVFLLHNSSSEGAANFSKVIRFTKHIVTALDIGPSATQVAAVAYGQDAEVKLFLNRSNTKHSVLEALQEDQFPSSGEPKTSLALTTVKDSVLGKEGGDGGENTTRVVIVVTSGPLHDPNDTKKAAQDLKDEGVEIIVVGVGSANPEEVESIASTSANQSEPLHFEPHDYNGLSSIQDKVVDRVCRVVDTTHVNATTRPEVVDTTHVNATTKPEVVTTTTVNATTKPAVVTTTTVNATTKPADAVNPDCRGKPLEIVFVLHNSSKVGAADFIKVTDFTKHIVTALDIGPNITQVATVAYGQDVAVQLFLNRSSTKHAIMEALQGIHFPSSGDPNISLALTTVKDSVFGTEGGDGRENRVVIVVTHGPLNDLNDTKKAAQDLKDEGVKIIAIGVGGANPEEMENIASMPANQSEPLHFEPHDYNGLSSIQDKVVGKVCRETSAEEPKKHQMKQTPSYTSLLQYAM